MVQDKKKRRFYKIKCTAAFDQVLNCQPKIVILNKMNCELMLTYDTPAYMFNVYKNQLSRQTGSRNLMGPKTASHDMGYLYEACDQISDLCHQ